MSGLQVAPSLTLPIDTITQVMGIFARRGAGKTYTASVIVEEVVKARLPVVVLDPLGAWWGLRSSADGKSAGLPVVILGGEHGDHPLESTAGGVIAELVIDHPNAYILDLSDFGSDMEQDRFVTAFLQRLYRGKARKRDPLLLVMDEADSFVPLQMMKGQEAMVGAGQTVVRRGRLRGLGVLVISQRPAAVHAGVRSQIELMIVGQVTSTHDGGAIDDWLKEKVTTEVRAEVRGSLGALDVGEIWISSPSWLRTTLRTKARARETFDSSATPKAGERRIEPRIMAKVDLDALGKRIAASAEQARANDPAELRKRIADLDRQLANAGAALVEERRKKAPAMQRINVPVLTAEQQKAIEALAGDSSRFAAAFERAAEEIKAALRTVGAREATAVRELASSTPREAEIRPRTAAPPVVAQPPRVPAHVAGNGSGSLGKAERAILSALATHRAGLTKRQLSLITGYSVNAGHTKNVLGALRSRGLVDRGEPIRATDEGLAELGDYEQLPTPGPELVSWWMSRLGKAERAMLEAFVAAYPDGLTKEALAESTGYAADTGHFKNTIGRIRGLGLVQSWRASEELMG